MKTKLVCFWVLWAWTGSVLAQSFEAQIEPLTRSPGHHFFGYIGHVGNASGRYIVALEVDFQDRMPEPGEAARIVLIDTHQDRSLRVVAETRAWNPQQGTMLYWNPSAPETQFFFNDRDPVSGRVFCVLFDISLGERVQEFRFPEAPVGNSGVAQKGGAFAAINYGRLARLRPVTGYPGAYDWTGDHPHPSDDGVFRIDVETGRAQLLVSFATLAEKLRSEDPDIDAKPLFINHTLWNRPSDLLFFFVRGRFGDRQHRINASFVMGPDGSGLRRLPHHLGGHPEWGSGHHLLGRLEESQVIYDVDRERVVATLANPEILPQPEGDIALSPDGRWLVNGYRQDGRNYYVFFRLTDGIWVRTAGIDVRPYTSGELRIDAAPCWNRDSNAVLFPALAEDKTRQLFVARLVGVPK